MFVLLLYSKYSVVSVLVLFEMRKTVWEQEKVLPLMINKEFRFV